MAAGRIIIPNVMPALDINGNPVAGAKLTFYANETTTLQAVYTTSALTVAHPNPITADAAGAFASIFADTSVAYSVAITDADNAPIVGLRNRDNVKASLFFGDDATTRADLTLSNLSNTATARTNLGVAIGTNVQAHDADLTAIAALTSAADKMPYSTGAQTWALADFTAAGRALVDDADATAQRATLGLVIGTDVQAYDADLTTWAGITPGTGVATALAANVGSAGAPVLFNGAGGTPSSMTLTNATGLPVVGGGTGAATAADARTNLAVVGTAALAASTGAALVGAIASGASAVTRTAQDKMRDTVSVLDFIPVAEHAAILAGTSTYDATTAINAAHTAALRVIYPGSSVDALYRATAISMPFGGSMIGDGVEAVRIFQIAATASNFITLTTGGPAGDITTGRVLFQNVTIEPANVAYTAIKIGPNVRASMVKFDNVVLKSQAVATFGSKPYTTTAGQIAIDASAGTASVFLGRGEGLIIQGFETAVKLAAGVNDWSFDGQCWMLDNKIVFDLTDVSCLNFMGSIESGVANARCYILRGATSHVLDLANRWELTETGCYGVEFAAGHTGTNIRIFNPNILIASDGGAIPGRKWTGTSPTDFCFDGYYLDGATQRPFSVSPGGSKLMPYIQRMGGSGFGNGSLTIGRDAGGADATITNSADGHLRIMAGNSLRLSGDGTTSYKLDVTSTGVGFQGTNGIAKPTVTGSRGGNAALASLLTELANYGLITDGSSA